MQHYRSLNDLSLQKSWLTVGVFDGVHRGHQKILDALSAGAHADGASAVVLTLDPHPSAVLTGKDIPMLTTPDERAELLAAHGVDVVITERFTPDLAAVSASEFMSRLTRRLGLARLLIGYDFALGKAREGDAARLTEIGNELKYEVEVVKAVSDESGVISSTAIRRLIGAGDVRAAAERLGHPYSLRGPVVHGDGRGRGIGFPTANIDYPAGKILPANGIYAAWAWLGDERHPAAVNVGVRPTVKSDQIIPTVEAYLLDFDRDIYGRILKLDFVNRLREELKFPSLEELIEQIQLDVARTREILSALT
ncbi:MAG TPA: bifunctional riboflavin kinase/FAD synthetase [Anaerolineales bacterium]|jgi:riboflavin kinase/FMN adenylyltransferase